MLWKNFLKVACPAKISSNNNSDVDIRQYYCKGVRKPCKIGRFSFFLKTNDELKIFIIVLGT